MSKLEVFQNGVFSDSGEPVFQIGSKNADGTYTATVFDLMTRAQAEAKLGEMQPSAPKKEAPKKAAPKKKAAKKTAKKKPAKKKEPKPKVEEPKPKSEEDEALDSFEKDINAAFGISDDDDE